MNGFRAILSLAIVVALGNIAWAQNGPVIVLVEASAQEAMKEAAKQFSAETKIPVKVTAGASSALVGQIANGTQAQVLLACSQEWANRLQEENLVAKTAPLLTTRVVIVVPKGNPAGIKTPEDLLSEKVKRVALEGTAGTYAQQALVTFEVYDPLLKGNHIAKGQDVRLALAFVDRGECEAAVVYETDVRNSKKVEVAYTFDSANHEKVVYPVVLLKLGDKNENARKFYDFLRSDAGCAIFEKHGFTRLEE